MFPLALRHDSVLDSGACSVRVLSLVGLDVVCEWHGFSALWTPAYAPSRGRLRASACTFSSPLAGARSSHRLSLVALGKLLLLPGPSRAVE